MMRSAVAVCAMAVVLAGGGRPASAEVLDAVYRGTLVCGKLPFTNTGMREAIAVTIAGGTAHYHHVVRLHQQPETVDEQGNGTVRGQAISLEGGWDGGARRYKASYSGTFVRRSAKLKGTQTWSVAGGTVTRNCSGVIKRPLKAFLPRKKRPRT